jgi:carbon-monoxide dehydrogenase iron sulfur subunit
MKGAVKVLVFHPKRCKGRYACMKACSKVHFDVETGGDKSALVIIKNKAGIYSCTVCNHCGLCIDVCPVLALRRLSGGPVTLNKNTCIGCQSCVAFCPIDGMRKASGHIVPFKCISCGQCVKACPEKALELIEVQISEVEREVYAKHGRVCK